MRKARHMIGIANDVADLGTLKINGETVDLDAPAPRTSVDGAVPPDTVPSTGPHQDQR